MSETKLDALRAKLKSIDADVNRRAAEYFGLCMELQNELAQSKREAYEAAASKDDARRYQRLRILGCAPMGSDLLEKGLVMRFTSLDAFLDDDIKAHPHRGEAAPASSQPEREGVPRRKLKEWHAFWAHYSSVSEGEQDELNEERLTTLEEMQSALSASENSGGSHE